MYFAVVHPIALQLGPVAIHWYGVLVATGFLTALWTAAIRARGIGVGQEVIMDLGIWLIVAGIVGARTFYVIGYWEDFRSNPLEIVRVDHGGLVFYCGFIFAVLASILFVRRKKLDFWKLADVCAPSIALGHVFGRLGCFMNGCCYGKVCSLPWAVRFPFDHETHGMPVHPTQIYESIGNFLLFSALWFFYPRRRYDGQVFWWYVLLYALLRFTVEFFRGDYTEYFIGNRFAPGQMTALCLAPIAIVFLWVLHRRMEAKRQ